MARAEDIKSAYEVAAWQIRILLILRIGLISVFLAIMTSIGRMMWDAYAGNPELIYNETIEKNRGWLSFAGFAGTILVYLADTSLRVPYYKTIVWAAELEAIMGMRDGLYSQMEAMLKTPDISIEPLRRIYSLGAIFFNAFPLLDIILYRFL